MEQVKHLLIWCLGLNYAILLAWCAVFMFGHDWMYRLHSRWFTLSVATFDALNWAGIVVYKLGIILFVLVPLIALLVA